MSGPVAAPIGTLLSVGRRDKSRLCLIERPWRRVPSPGRPCALCHPGGDALGHGVGQLRADDDCDAHVAIVAGPRRVPICLASLRFALAKPRVNFDAAAPPGRSSLQRHGGLSCENRLLLGS